MPYIEYVSGITPAVADGDNIYLKNQGTRDGAIFTADWVLARVAEGRVFAANAGTLTAPITFGAGALDSTEYDLFVSVPSGTTIGILELEVHMETFGTDAIMEILGISGTGGTTGAGTSITVRNLRTDAPFTTNCTVTAAATATSGVAITGVEFFREGRARVKTITTFGSTGGPTQQQHFKWNHKDSGYLPIVVGAGQVGVYAASQAGTGFIKLIWVEMPSTRIV